MPLIEEEREEKEKEKEESAEAESYEKAESSAFLYLTDLISVLNSLSIKIEVLLKLLDQSELPPSVRKVFSLLRETEQLKSTLEVSQEKIETVRAAAEGALLATAAIEFVKRLEFAKRTNGGDR